MTRKLTSRASARLLWGACALGLAACSSADEGWAPPIKDNNAFANEVYPILIRDCAFETCHGSEQRFFRVWGLGRTRLGMRTAFGCLPTEMDDKTKVCKVKDEIDATFDNAISFIDQEDPKRSLILRKPLATEAGGMGHLGVDKFGRNLYRSIDSPGYLTLSRWVFSTGP